jgi:hypothetical protein
MFNKELENTTTKQKARLSVGTKGIMGNHMIGAIAPIM